MANSLDPNQTAPEGAVWSGSTLFAYDILSDLLVYKILGHLPFFLFFRENKCVYLKCQAFFVFVFFFEKNKMNLICCYCDCGFRGKNKGEFSVVWKLIS